jgi:hypothetical protein
MEIFINLKDLQELNLSPTLYCYLASVYFEQEYTLASEQVKEYMNDKLEQSGYLKNSAEGIILRDKCHELFKKGIPNKESVETWIEEWRNLFPTGVKSGGRPVRGDKKGVVAKMVSFVKANPTITKEEIMDATKQYVFDSSLKSYQYMICADYFISKNNSSMLGAMIEDVQLRGSKLKKNSDEGTSSWHREI